MRGSAVSSLAAAAVLSLVGVVGVQAARAMESHSKPAGVPVIYCVKGGRSERIVWLMEELGLPYKLAIREGDMSDTLSADGSVDPMNMAPAVAIDGQVLFETGLVVEYILDRYGKGRLVPARSSANYWKYRLYMQFADGSAIPRVIPDYASKKAGKTLPSVYGSQDNLPRLLNFIEAELKDRTYLAGPAFSAADIMMSYPLELAKESVGGFHDYPAIEAYYARITARDAHKKAVSAINRS
jgi:glutathione S-transferase